MWSGGIQVHTNYDGTEKITSNMEMSRFTSDQTKNKVQFRYSVILLKIYTQSSQTNYSRLCHNEVLMTWGSENRYNQNLDASSYQQIIYRPIINDI